ncbi:hypothetical protein FOCC_FOCC007945 [Frankliniella occidentalis]|nr:hypothetical protein FOCC_FOCC007945 [Frankliniella occidentalis]
MRVLHETPLAPVGDTFVKVTGNGSLNVSKSILLRFMNERIFFNCGQSGESTFKGTLNHVFVTHLDWIKIGGIISLIYKASSSKLEEVTFYGPPGLVKVFESSAFESDLLQVKTVPLSLKDGVSHKSCDVDKSWFRKKFTYKPVVQEESLLDRVPQNYIDLNTAHSYIIKFVSKNAWVLSECVKRGVKPGENMQKLWRGESVVLEDGSIVTPEDVIKSDNFPNVIVLDVPSEGFIEDLMQKEEYKEFFSSTKQKQNSCLVVHFSPVNVMKDERYISWMQCFPPTTKHLIVNESNLWQTPERVLNRQEICRLISPEFFPQLISNVIRTPNHPSHYTVREVLEADEPASYVPDKNSERWLQEWKNIPKEVQILESWPGTTINLRSLLPVRSFQPFMVSEDPIKSRKLFNICSKTSPKNPKITFLGTGSQGNSAYRNSSGILLEMSSDCSIMLDCGDGMMHQLSCLNGTSQREKVLSSLKCIFVSHTHADHHAGIIGLLLEIRKNNISKGRKNKLIILVPPVFVSWLETYHHKFQPILDDVILINLSDMVTLRHSDEEFNSLFRKHLGMKKVLVCYAKHSAFSYCICFEHSSGWKISYSGDTQMNRNFVDIGERSDLLIHEATFGTGLDLMAKQARHSTTKDAIAVGKMMGAKQIILTHFSKRYPAIPCIQNIEHTSNVSVAFDFLQCHLSDFHHLPKLNDCYKKVFASFEAENIEEHNRLLTRESLLSEMTKTRGPYSKEELQ